MNTYCVGDVQGCLDELQRLLDSVRFDPARDRLVLLGDLINRGPKSLQTLRFCRQLGPACEAVLGNHDLSILARTQGQDPSRLNRTASQILDAPDGSELLHWLQQRPLALHKRCQGQDILMVHAGLPPQWDLAMTLQLAGEVEQVLREDASHYFAAMYGDQPDLWQADLSGMARLRFITNCLTRLRYCSADGRLALEHKSADGALLRGADQQILMPWFAVPTRRSREHRVLFGHWSTLRQIYWPQYRVWGLDSGCVWGGRLSALHLQSLRLIQAPA